MTSPTSIQNTIGNQAQSIGLAAWIPLDIAQEESGFQNPPPHWDGTGYAYGVFQEHPGFQGVNDPVTLGQPEQNIVIAENAMLPWYQKGQQQGLTGTNLLDYVANNSGWPTEAGVAAANANEPTYDPSLNSIYQKTGGSSRSAGSLLGGFLSGIGQGLVNSQPTQQQAQQEIAAVSNPASGIVSGIISWLSAVFSLSHVLQWGIALLAAIFLGIVVVQAVRA